MRCIGWLRALWLALVYLGGCAIATEDPERALSAASDGLRRCDGMTIASRDELDAARSCTTIDGTLEFRLRELERVTADDMPNLARVTGSLLVIPAGRGHLREFTLPALREVGTPDDGRDDLLEIGWDAHSMTRIALPELHAMHGSLIVAALGALTEIDLRALRFVDGAFGLGSLPSLRTLRVSESLEVGARVVFDNLCSLPANALPDIVPNTNGAPELGGIGCCTSSAFECEFAACACDDPSR